MALLNYTTTVAASKTANEIVGILAKGGAKQVMTEYDNGRPVGIAFMLDTPYGLRHFVLPIDVPAVERTMRRDRIAQRYLNTEQAERVGWRILKDWIEAQLAIVATQMVAIDQVMLPYMTADDGRTVYALYRDQQLALGAGS